MSKYIKIDRIEEVQIIAFEMLKEFDRLCKEADIPYSLAGGTLLGAIRHGGFIPWDDDVDVFMLRKDYERFLQEYAGANLKDPHYHVVTGRADIPGITFARIIDDRTQVDCKTSTAINNLWIDIFPLDAIPTDLEERSEFIARMRYLRRIRILLNAPPMTGKTKLKKIVKTPVTSIGRQLGMQKTICQKIEQESQKYEQEDVEAVAEIVAQAAIKGTVCRNTFTQSVEVPFEGQMFSAMPDYNRYLTGQYGEYLQLPPEGKRKAHKVSVKIEISKYDEQTREKLLYYIQKKDMEARNQEALDVFLKEKECEKRTGETAGRNT